MVLTTSNRRGLAALVVVLLLAGGCSDGSPGPAQTSEPARQHKETVSLGDRPFTLYVPSSYRAGTALPLLILLHGYTSSGADQERYMKIAPEAEKRGFLYATPDGTKDQNGDRFWNATAACCNLDGSTVDDSGYVAELIGAVSAQYTVDPARVYFVGHSNGGFMSFRMACDHADLIAAIAVLNGAMHDDTSLCTPSRPVSVLDIHSDADELIHYDGGVIRGNHYPSAAATVGSWVILDGCTELPETSAEQLDLASDVDGSETTVKTYGGCRGGSTVALWTIHGGRHVPAFTEEFVPAVLDFLLAHSAS